MILNVRLILLLQKALKGSGGHGQPTVFLVTDVQIKEECFLEDVDNMLNTGEVPNLFSSEEKAEVIDLVQAAVEATNRKGSSDDMSPLALYAKFVSRCRANLHIVIAFSPIGEAFRNRLRQFPSLINCCTIDWFMVTFT